LAAAVNRLLQGHAERIIIVTQGAEGCTVYQNQDSRHVPAFAVSEVDPTGAGDCFDAGFLSRWLAGDSPVEAAAFANACGALAVTAQGPMAGAKTLAEVRAFMRATQPKEGFD
jgi:sugar/nucleoside kinase (ribokinase family)